MTSDTLFIMINKNLMDIVISTAQQAGEVLLSYFNGEHTLTSKDNLVESKDFVTLADIASQATILGALQARRPSDIFIAEENAEEFNVLAANPEAPTEQLVWYIDPLDGTQNFSRGFENFSISIAANYANTGKAALGLVYAPALNKLYFAYNGIPYKQNSKGDIEVMMTNKNLTASILSTGVPYEDNEQTLLYQVLPTLMQHFGTARDLGSSALNLAFLAEGRFEGTLEVSIKTWDFMAGKAIVEACGLYIDVIRNPRTGSFIVYAAKDAYNFTILDKSMRTLA